MAAADTAKLVASLTLDAKGFQKGVAGASASLGKLESTVGNVGRRAGEGLRSFGRNIGLIGVAAAGGIAVAVKGGLDNLAKLETAISSVDGAIEQLGLTGQVTGEQVAAMANKIEKDIGAAFDDKEITQAAATLLRFGKVTPKNLEQALVVMTDLAVKTGDVESASTLLAKALADPAKAAGKLSRVGVILTKSQQDLIKELVKAGDAAGAQKVILDELARTTGGAALASQGKYARSIALLNDVVEDAQKALAVGFLPIIEKVANKLSTALADPKFVKGLEAFGKELAGGLDDLISVAEKLPWATIGDSLRLAGAGAKAVLTAFTSLPPWVQTAVITGWGLNKLTGGALGGIIKELGTGLIKGVLGINAGVVNINAATVNGVGGVPGTGGKAAGAASSVGTAVQAVVIAGVVQGAAAQLAGAIAGPVGEEVQKAVGGGPTNIFGPLDRLVSALQGDLRSPLEKTEQNTKVSKALLGEIATEQAKLSNVTNERLESIRGQQATQAAALITASQGEKTAIINAAASQRAEQAKTTAAAQAAAFAIRDKDLSVAITNVNNTKVNVSVRETIQTTTTHKQYQRFIQ